MIDNLSIRGCRIRSTAPMRIGSRLELEFQHSDSSFPVTIEEAVVRSIADGAIGLRFTKLHRSDERRIRQLIDVWLPELLPLGLAWSRLFSVAIAIPLRWFCSTFPVLRFYVRCGNLQHTFCHHYPSLSGHERKVGGQCDGANTLTV